MFSFIKFACLFLAFSFFVALPEFNLIYAQQTLACSSIGINSQVLDQPDSIPDGVSLLKIKLTGLTEQGVYKLRVGVPLDRNEYYSDSAVSSNGEVTLAITDSHILHKRPPYNGTLEYSPDGITFNHNYCNNITYTIGGSSNCSISTNPSTITTNQSFTFTVYGTGRGAYDIIIDPDFDHIFAQVDVSSQGFGTSQPVTVNNPGAYKFILFTVVPGGQWCSVTKQITPSQPGNLGEVGCDLISPDPTTSSKEYKVRVFNLQADVMSSSATNRAYVANLSKDEGSSKITDTKVIGLTVNTVDMSLGNITDDGSYSYNVTGSNGQVCYNTFPVKNGAVVPGSGTGPGVTVCSGPNCTKAGGTACTSGSGTSPGFQTAIGCIRTSPAELVKDFMTFIISLAGGMAFLMMLLGAFGMLTSAGNPESLAAGKDRFTNAIIGLLFVIFAVLLLQIIGFDILKLPGFGR